MVLTIKDIEKIIPHRYPFLLLDKIIEGVAVFTTQSTFTSSNETLPTFLE